MEPLLVRLMQLPESVSSIRSAVAKFQNFFVTAPSEARGSALFTCSCKQNAFCDPEFSASKIQIFHIVRRKEIIANHWKGMALEPIEIGGDHS